MLDTISMSKEFFFNVFNRLVSIFNLNNRNCSDMLKKKKYDKRKFLQPK